MRPAGFRTAAGSRAMRHTEFARRIMERYLGSGIYDLNPASFVFADWWNGERQEQERERWRLEERIMQISSVVNRLERQSQIPAVHQQTISQLKSAVAVYEKKFLQSDRELKKIYGDILSRTAKEKTKVQVEETEARLKKLYERLHRRLEESGKREVPPVSVSPLMSISQLGKMTEYEKREFRTAFNRFFREEEERDGTSYVHPDRIMVRPQPVRPVVGPEPDLTGRSQEQETVLRDHDIRTVQAAGKCVKSFEEYEVKMREFAEKLEIQIRQTEELKTVRYQTFETAEIQRIVNRTLKQLKSQIRLERLQRGLD